MYFFVGSIRYTLNAIRWREIDKQVAKVYNLIQFITGF